MKKMTVEFRAVNNPTTWRRDKFDLKFARTLGEAEPEVEPLPDVEHELEPGPGVRQVFLVYC